MDSRTQVFGAEVVAAVEAVRPGALIATDADGTLWAADLGDDTVRAAAVSPSWVERPIDVEGYLAFLEADYVGGCRAAADHLRDIPEEAAKAAFRAYFPPRLNPRRYLFDALKAATERGVRVYVVSAAPRVAAEIGLEIAGVSWPVIGIELDVEPAPIGEGKVAAWRARGLPPPALALGDSPWDEPLLCSASLGLRLVHAARDPHRETRLCDLPRR